MKITGYKNKSHFWPHLLFGMLALFLLPSNQDIKNVNDNQVNYHSLQQVEYSQNDIVSIQQDHFVIEQFDAIELPKFLQNPPHFIEQVLVEQYPIRAGPSLLN